MAHLGRRPNAYQRSALQWRYPSCAAAGCVDQMRLENDHREDWVKTHFTAFDLMDRFCRFHHWLKTNEGWALVEGKGKRASCRPTTRVIHGTNDERPDSGPQESEGDRE